MALSNALSTGVSGLVSHQVAMDNLGNNLANINTFGFKKGVYQFATLLEQSMRGGMGASGTRGAVNPISLGGGTSTASINKVFTQGNLEPTGSFNDMAIRGSGFFVVSDGRGGTAYTRDGSFCIGDDGYLTTGNGLYVMGTNAVRRADGSTSIPQDAKLEKIAIPLQSTGGMAKTTTVSFGGNLSSAQKVAAGLSLFGSNPPTVNDRQAWMTPAPGKTDATWSALEQDSYIISKEMIDLAQSQGITIPGGLAGNVSTSTSGMTVNPATQSSYYALSPATGKVQDVSTVDADGNRVPANVGELLAAGMIPASRQISTINGGNVQTSAAFGVKVPECLREGTVVEHEGRRYTVRNDSTYPPWFYESNGGDFATAAGQDNAAIRANPEAAWPHGFQGTAVNPGKVPASLGDLPRPGESFPATVDTPLEELYFYNGNQWTKMFDKLKEGDEITLTFDKGRGKVEASFIYNRPGSPAPFGNQQKVDVEKSYTLEHFLAFMAGDVDEPGAAAAQITPAMFGAPVTAAFPDGDHTDPAFDKAGYDAALANYSLAKSDRNLGTTGGVMGLVDVPPNIASDKGGVDSCNSPMETAGAFTREGVSKAEYERWDPVLQQYAKVPGDSFNISLVSNLGADNALSNISITHNNVTHKNVFSEENEYAAPEGGSATATATFYDSLGNAHTATLRLALVEEDSNFSTWRWYADSEADSDFAWGSDDQGNLVSNLSVGTGLIRFDSDGNYVSGSDVSETGGIVINQVNRGVDEPIVIRITDGMSGKQDLDFSGLTQNSRGSDVSLTEQNGSAPGTLDRYEVASDGTINGVYSTGAVIELGRMVLANVPNPNGLVAASGNMFHTSPSSGDAVYGYPELGGRGAIVQYNLELSNVEMANEFTTMISIQRGYQANTRVITTADEMLQELLSMKR